MHPLLKIFFTGMLVSFLGSLPLGTLNIAAMQISISDGITAAMLFSAGSLLVEIIYVRISLVAMDWIRKQEKVLKALEWVTLLIRFFACTRSIIYLLNDRMFTYDE